MKAQTITMKPKRSVECHRERATMEGSELIEGTSEPVRYQTQLTNGTHFALSDTTRDKGRSELGFRSHDLLKATLASCMNITQRMYARS